MKTTIKVAIILCSMFYAYVIFVVSKMDLYLLGIFFTILYIILLLYFIKIINLIFFGNKYKFDFCAYFNVKTEDEIDKGYYNYNFDLVKIKFSKTHGYFGTYWWATLTLFSYTIGIGIAPKEIL